MADNTNENKTPDSMDQDETGMDNGTVGGDMGISESSSSADETGNTRNSGSGGTMSGDTGGGSSSGSNAQGAQTGLGTQGSASNAGGNAAGSNSGES